MSQLGQAGIGLSEEASSSLIPPAVEEVLKTSPIGYLSVTSKKGDLYSYPVAYHYSDRKVYMITPVSAAKMKFMRANPNISFLVDNKKITLDCCGAMIQGKARIISMAKMIASIISLGPKMRDFAKKYPGMFTFYLKGKSLPDERKLYKYRFIRIDPTKIIFWTGYKFGKYIPEKKAVSNQEIPKDPSEMEGLASLLATADAESEEGFKPGELPTDNDWLSGLDSAVSNGILSGDERELIGMYKKPLGTAGNVKPGELSSGEKSLLKKWKATKN
jgi:nitroimidazol reductase NimA-like FMN-containing flavoprotein (pyridoxamine 5'-phosphate oxidase superfamily)